MRLKNVIDILCVIFFLFFSIWLFHKSFGYVKETHSFRIARNQVGDFGLHLALIRSISWGDNWTAQSPFYPGVPLRYHFVTDFLVGILERYGMRIDYAYNGVSSFFFVVLLYFIYKIPQVLFREGIYVGIVSVMLFLFPSTLSWLEFIRTHGIFNLRLSDVWRLPDYIHKGPFDSSMISIYFSLNPYLNQRHLVAGMALGLGLIYIILLSLLNNKNISSSKAVAIGVITSLLLYVHSLISLATFMVSLLLLVFYNKKKLALYYFVAFVVAVLPFMNTMMTSLPHQIIRIGFLTPQPVTILKVLEYWWVNLGISIPLVIFGFVKSNRKQRSILLSFLALFIVANIVQFSYRIEHNHSLINYFLIAMSWFVAYTLLKLWKSNRLKRLISVISFVVLIFSGILNLMAVKNDFQFLVTDAPANRFMEWIRLKTDRRAVFLSWDEQYDPVTLSGRRSYIGHPYYTTVMGYDVNDRTLFRKKIYEAQTNVVFTEAKERGIDYIVLPRGQAANFSFVPNYQFFESSLGSVYEDGIVLVYAL